MCFLTNPSNREVIIRTKMNKEEVKMKGKKTELREEKNKESAKGEGRTRSTETETMNEVQNSLWMNVQRFAS